MLAPDSPTTDGTSTPSPELVRAAFRDLHAARLHGFALLMTLGDRADAARLTSGALAAGLIRVEELRHPERGAAWLRAEVVRHYRPARPVGSRTSERRAALAEMSVSARALAGLAALGRHERAAVVAGLVERLDRRDVATIVGRDGARLESLVNRAMQRYLAAYQASPPPSAGDGEVGPTAERVRSIAARALA